MAATRPRVGAFTCCAFLVLSAFAAPVVAQSPDQPVVAQSPDQEAWTPPPHVRPSPDLQALVDEASLRSPAIRALRAQLETLDVTVYIRTRVFLQLDLDGRVALLATHGRHRYLVIELSCARSTLTQMAALGHELFHAVEIAGQPSIVDARSLAAFYERIGVETSDSIGRRTFETDAAANAGRRARQELLKHTTRSGNGS
jgi:hypothetical protein